MTSEVLQANGFPVTPELMALKNAVNGARIFDPGLGQPPICTVDGVREVISVDGGFDLWVPRRKPRDYGLMVDDRTPWRLGASLVQAMAFLHGQTKAEVLGMEATS
jgi:hypothetical protein